MENGKKIGTIIQGLGFGHITLVMENKIEKKRENEEETGMRWEVGLGAMQAGYETQAPAET